MIPISIPSFNLGTTVERCAQSVAGKAGWKTDHAGAIYSRDGHYIGASLTEIAAAMADLGWFYPNGHGVNWRAINSSAHSEAFPMSGYTWSAPAFSSKQSLDLLEEIVAVSVGQVRLRAAAKGGQP